MNASILDGVMKIAGGGVMGALITGLFGWLSKRDAAHAAQPANVLSSAAALQDAVNSAVDKLITELRAEIEDLKDGVEKLKQENDHCRGENRDMKQQLASLARELQRAGIDVATATKPGSFLVVEDRRATVLEPSSDAPDQGRSSRRSNRPRARAKP